MSRQILPKTYCQNGYVGVIWLHTIMDKASMVGDHTIPFVIYEPVCDVDYLGDIPPVDAALKLIVENLISSKLPLLYQDHHPV